MCPESYYSCLQCVLGYSKLISREHLFVSTVLGELYIFTDCLAFLDVVVSFDKGLFEYFVFWELNILVEVPNLHNSDSLAFLGLVVSSSLQIATQRLDFLVLVDCSVHSSIDSLAFSELVLSSFTKGLFKSMVFGEPLES